MNKPDTQTLEFNHHFFGVVRVTCPIGKDIYKERDLKIKELNAEYEEYKRRNLTK